MKYLGIKWEDAPTDTAVWIVDNNTTDRAGCDGWYMYERSIDCYRRISDKSIVSRGLEMRGEVAVHHRQEQPMPSKSEWMPVVGEECVVSYPYEDGNFKCFDGEKVLIISCGRCEMTSEYVYTGHNTKHGYVALSAKGYHPLKTAEEKKREYNYGEILKILNLIHSSDFCPVEAASVLAHEGFTAPEGEL